MGNQSHGYSYVRIDPWDGFPIRGFIFFLCCPRKVPSLFSTKSGSLNLVTILGRASGALLYERAGEYETLGQGARARGGLERGYAVDPSNENVGARLR